jgi:hypothetical protein
MRPLLASTIAATALAFSAQGAAGAANPAPVAGPLQSAVYDKDDPAVFQQAQFYLWAGHRFCWYWNGWQGPGWYWCGYAWHSGWGWGGPYGWHGWRGGGPYRGYHGGPGWNHNHAWNGRPGWNGHPGAYNRSFNAPSHNFNGAARFNNGAHMSHSLGGPHGGPGGHGGPHHR